MSTVYFSHRFLQSKENNNISITYKQYVAIYCRCSFALAADTHLHKHIIICKKYVSIYVPIFDKKRFCFKQNVVSP